MILLLYPPWYETIKRTEHEEKERCRWLSQWFTGQPCLLAALLSISFGVICDAVDDLFTSWSNHVQVVGAAGYQLMVHQLLLIITLLSIWLSLTMAMVTLFGAVHFWLKNSTEEVAITPLRRYPTISIVVPAHNEDVVIAQTMSALLNLNYPADKVELLLYSDNSEDHTADEMRRVQQLPEYRDRNIVIVERTGKGGKAGVLNDSLEIATGEYIAVYDADAICVFWAQPLKIQNATRRSLVATKPVMRNKTY